MKFERYLSEQNPQWFGKEIETGTKRECLNEILEELSIDHIIAISGIRRCGKSFLMKQIICEMIKREIAPDNILFINLEQIIYTEENTGKILDELLGDYRSLRNPNGRIYVFLDEIQTLEKWEIWLKYQYDLRNDIKFFITGSNSQLLSSEFASRLTGRVIEHRIHPFSFMEYLHLLKFDLGDPNSWVLKIDKILYNLDNYMQNGGMPEILAIKNKEIARTIITSTFDSIIYKDIVPRFAIRKAGTLRKLAFYIVGHSSNINNYEKIAKMLNMNRNTVHDFINYLQTSLLVRIINKFDFSEKRQLLSQKKSYICDNSFITKLAFQFSPNKGKLLENLVLNQLKRLFSRTYYYKNNNECDFIIYDHHRESAAYQVCYHLNENNRQKELRGLASGCHKINLNQGTILTWNQEEEVDYNGIQAHIIPVWKWLLVGS